MGYKVAVAGATGNVGREMLNILAEREFPADEVVALQPLARAYRSCEDAPAEFFSPALVVRVRHRAVARIHRMILQWFL